MAKERSQNPAPGDTISLRLNAFNSNLQVDLYAIEKVEIYRLDPARCTTECTDGRVLVATIDGGDVTSSGTGAYLCDLELTSPTYTIGKYLDIWYVVPREDDTAIKITNVFEVYSDLWYFSPTPAVYGFSFEFQPNMIRSGSKKWITIKITPNIPHATDLQRYYHNLAISSNLKINIEANCLPCPPGEDDARMIVEDELVTVRDKVFGHYLIDTTEDGLDLDCGIYNIWFVLTYAESIEVSPKMQFQIF